ncbi:MAG: hypothetical protein ACRCTL_06660 [Pseudomonas sp.]
MCTSILLRDLFNEPAHYVWRASEGGSAQTRTENGGARHFAGERRGHQEVLEFDWLITTSHKWTASFLFLPQSTVIADLGP